VDEVLHDERSALGAHGALSAPLAGTNTARSQVPPRLPPSALADTISNHQGGTVLVRPGRSGRIRMVAVMAAGALLAPTVAAAADTRFDDVSAGNVHANAIESLAESGIIQGTSTTTFSPSATLTRGQLATIVAGAADLDRSTDTPFTDLAGTPHANNIAAAEAAGLVFGYDDGTYRPNLPVNRGQVASVLERWLEPPAGPTDAFPDLERTVHRRAIEALSGIGVALGTPDGTFQPTAHLRRDHAASFMYRALNWLDAQPASYDLTVLGTSDLHNFALDWDYYNDREFSAQNVGLARVGTLIEQLREERGADSTLLLDNGDTFQGNPLGSYFANQARITEPDADPHPMALAMNALGYDAMVAGNHEFNYGLDFLAAVEEQVDFPLLGANVREHGTGDEYLEPYTVLTVEPEGHDPIEVGVLGLTTPGSAVWDRSHVEGNVTFTDGVETAETYVPILLDDEGVDVVIVIAHAGIDGGSSYGDAIPESENFVRQLAEEVPGIDAIVSGHAHRNVPEERIVNVETGDEVVVTMPGAWGRFLSVIDIEFVDAGDGWTVASVSSETRSTANVPQTSTVVDLVIDAHNTVVEFVNSKVGTSVEELSMQYANLEDVPALDIINHVQTVATEDYVADTEWSDLPVLSLAAPFNLSARLPAGDVSIRDIAGLYIYDNTLVAVEMTGAELEDYLEWSAEYFEGVEDAGPFARSEIQTTKPSYNYDVLSGVTYDLDLAQPVGSRVVDLEFEGAPIDPAQRFVVVTNNYRANGGGGAPHIDEAPIVWDSLLENRQLIIDWVIETGVVDPADFASVDWRLLADGTPITFTD
jgi:2',3'-cyclic-nucleotide 2'-phosphodiesterase / 3'-nucleotidase